MYKNVALTGATGTMGKSSLEALLKVQGLNIKVLARKSKKNIKLLSPLTEKGAVSVVWGDLESYEDVLSLVKGSDIVLHIGGMVSPRADWYPEQTMRVNTTAMKNIVKAMESLKMYDTPLVNIGSVAQTGNREIYNRFGRTGDPIAPARFDSYALSKCKAELILAESSLRKWVSLRQSGILHSELLGKANDPIAFHVPINGMLEWATVEDSGRLMANICTKELPDEFWNRFYNISSGKQYRLTNYEFETMILKAIGAPGPEKIFDTKWFALKNFHGQWYADADILEKYLSFRENKDPKEYFRDMAKKAPSYLKMAGLVPAFIMKLFMGTVAMNKTLGTRYWIKSGNKARIDAFWGGIDNYNAIPDWSGFGLSFPDADCSGEELDRLLLDHGYYDAKPMAELSFQDLVTVARFRGGHVLSGQMPGGMELWDTPILWRCHDGHEFTMKPRTVILGGYWCPECMEDTEGYQKQAVHNRFLAQVVAPLHD